MMTTSSSRKSLLLWLLAAVITLSSVAYQRITGPSHPVRGKVEIGGDMISYKLVRTCETISDAVVEIKVPSSDVTGEIRLRRYKSHDNWSVERMSRDGEHLIAHIPKQPAAGKVMYQITLIDSGGTEYALTDEPVVIRFKGPVPKAVLFPHILFMFTAMFLSTRTGLGALVRLKNVDRYTLVTITLLFFGGLIFGPLVQKHAFGAFWTGWPFGHDLTDNKTLVAFLFWLFALWRIKRTGSGRMWVIIASVVTLLIYLIPHSVLGSEIDYTKTE